MYLEYLGDSIELPLGETVVGRDVGCALRFNDPSVSRRHLRFVHRADDVFVEDLRSSNGTVVNGANVTAPVRLADGDEIIVGSRVITVRVLDDEDPIEAPSTLVLDERLKPSPRKVAVLPEEISTARAPTSQMPRVLPPGASQRCPRCGAPVGASDLKCTVCSYRWGSRVMSQPTVPPLTKIPLRRHDRVPLELRLIYVSDELEIEATTLDLSQSGVFVRTEIFDPVGTTCRLTMLMDGGPPLQLAGVVRRVVETDNPRREPCGLGVEFEGLGDKERAWIDIAIVRITS
jgi:pSer/pThr/pTyr-binding forkhead associated (FHA) protein